MIYNVTEPYFHNELIIRIIEQIESTDCRNTIFLINVMVAFEREVWQKIL